MKSTPAHGYQEPGPAPPPPRLSTYMQACKTPQLVSPSAHRHKEPGARHERHIRVRGRGCQPCCRARARHAERRRGAALPRRRGAGLRLLSGRPAVRPRLGPAAAPCPLTLCPAAAPVWSRSVQPQPPSARALSSCRDLSVHAQSRACSRVRAGICWKRSCTTSARAACSPSNTAVSGCLCYRWHAFRGPPMVALSYSRDRGRARRAGGSGAAQVERIAAPPASDAERAARAGSPTTSAWWAS